MSKRNNDIFLILWALLFIGNIIILLYNSSKFHFLLTGFTAGFFLNTLMNNPLLNSYEKYMNHTHKFIEKLFDEKKKSNSLRGNKK